jgi:uncharacterized protein with ParB-like and HNH nuclease domain
LRQFDSNEEYFLGSIVTFENDNNKKEVIDGQHRLTTLIFIACIYAKFGNMQDEKSKSTQKRIAHMFVENK